MHVSAEYLPLTSRPGQVQAVHGKQHTSSGAALLSPKSGSRAASFGPAGWLLVCMVWFSLGCCCEAFFLNTS